MRNGTQRDMDNTCTAVRLDGGPTATVICLLSYSFLHLRDGIMLFCQPNLIYVNCRHHLCISVQPFSNKSHEVEPLLTSIKPQHSIKGRLLLSIYSQLSVEQYGEIGDWSLVWIKVGETINSPNATSTICLGLLGRSRIKIFDKENEFSMIFLLLYEHKVLPH